MYILNISAEKGRSSGIGQNTLEITNSFSTNGPKLLILLFLKSMAYKWHLNTTKLKPTNQQIFFFFLSLWKRLKTDVIAAYLSEFYEMLSFSPSPVFPIFLSSVAWFSKTFIICADYALPFPVFPIPPCNHYQYHTEAIKRRQERNNLNTMFSVVPF